MIDNPYASRAVPETTECKCCQGLSRLTGVVDFSRCGRDWIAQAKVEPYAGWPVYFYLCRECGFVFTRALDDWTNAQFSRHIYNEDYVLQDPDYLHDRPKANADMISQVFGDDKQTTTILDYGSGAGILENFLTQHGFQSVTSYDPFSSPTRPDGKYNMITCFEVFEHTIDPIGLMSDIVSYLDTDGAIFFSTGLCTPEVVQQGIANWWYCAPRNGHVSFYSRETLMRLAQKYGLKHGWFDDWRHLFFRDHKPGWLRRHLPD